MGLDLRSFPPHSHLIADADLYAAQQQQDTRASTDNYGDSRVDLSQEPVPGSPGSAGDLLEQILERLDKSGPVRGVVMDVW